jgi:hypothetical protein
MISSQIVALASPGVKYATYEMKVENWNMGTLISRPATEPG